MDGARARALSTQKVSETLSGPPFSVSPSPIPHARSSILVRVIACQNGTLRAFEQSSVMEVSERASWRQPSFSSRCSLIFHNRPALHVICTWTHPIFTTGDMLSVE